MKVVILPLELYSNAVKVNLLRWEQRSRVPKVQVHQSKQKCKIFVIRCIKN